MAVASGQLRWEVLELGQALLVTSISVKPKLSVTHQTYIARACDVRGVVVEVV